MDVKNIGLFLLKLRKENNLTQKDIAKLCNVSAQAVSKWERGESVPDVELLERLSIMYKISINEIINGEKKELYVDLEKRRNIIMLTTSILVFIAYAFNFFRGQVELLGMTEFEANIKGYHMIFNGTGGFAVYLTWFVFLILVSQLIINIFVLAKVILRKPGINLYMVFSSAAVLTVSAILFFAPDFFAFPQLIIIICMVTALIIGHKSEKRDISGNRWSIKERLEKLYIPIPDTTKSNKLIRWNRIASLVGIIAYGIFFVVLGSGIIITELKGGYQYGGRGQDLWFLFIVIIVLITMITSFRFLKYMTARIVMVITGALTLIMPGLLTGPIIKYGFCGIGIPGYMLIIGLLAVPAMLFYNAYRMGRVKKEIQ